MNLDFLAGFGRAFVPDKFRPKMHEWVLKAGVTKIPYGTFGLVFLITLALTYGIYLILIYPALIGKSGGFVLFATFASWVVVQGIMVAIFSMGVFMVFSMKIYTRTKTMENILPEYLTLVISNLKGGMSFENALWSAIKPQFGVLADEITIVSKKVMTGNDTADALLEFAKKYDSPTLQRSMNLIISEVQSGGEVADVIQKVNNNLVKAREIKEELSSSVVSFVIFIAVIVLAISPVLFALAFQLLNIMVSFVGSLAESLSGGGGGGGVNISLEAPKVDAGEFKIFSIAAINVIAIFASMIVAIIQTGDIKGGLKYVPIFCIVSSALYLISSYGLDMVFGGLAI